jgi:hypothetical protein
MRFFYKRTRFGRYTTYPGSTDARYCADSTPQIDEGSFHQREAGWGARNKCQEREESHRGEECLGPPDTLEYANRLPAVDVTRKIQGLKAWKGGSMTIVCRVG